MSLDVADIASLLEELRACYPVAPYKGMPCDPGDPEADEFNRLFGNTSWIDHSPHQYGDFIMVYAFMSWESYVYFFPGYMTAALNEFCEENSRLAVYTNLEIWIHDRSPGRRYVLELLSEKQRICVSKFIGLEVQYWQSEGVEYSELESTGADKSLWTSIESSF